MSKRRDPGTFVVLGSPSSLVSYAVTVRPRSIRTRSHATFLPVSKRIRDESPTYLCTVRK